MKRFWKWLQEHPYGMILGLLGIATLLSALLDFNTTYEPVLEPPPDPRPALHLEEGYFAGDLDIEAFLKPAMLPGGEYIVQLFSRSGNCISLYYDSEASAWSAYGILRGYYGGEE